MIALKYSLLGIKLCREEGAVEAAARTQAGGGVGGVAVLFARLPPPGSLASYRFGPEMYFGSD